MGKKSRRPQAPKRDKRQQQEDAARRRSMKIAEQSMYLDPARQRFPR